MSPKDPLSIEADRRRFFENEAGDNQNAEVFTEYLAETVQMTRAQWQLLDAAGNRCGLGLSDYILMAALAAARTIVPAACQAGDVETPMPGLFTRGGEK